MTAALPTSEERSRGLRLMIVRLLAGAGAVGLIIVAISLVATALGVSFAVPAIAVVGALL